VTRETEYNKKAKSKTNIKTKTKTANFFYFFSSSSKFEKNEVLENTPGCHIFNSGKFFSHIPSTFFLFFFFIFDLANLPCVSVCGTERMRWRVSVGRISPSPIYHACVRASTNESASADFPLQLQYPGTRDRERRTAV